MSCGSIAAWNFRVPIPLLTSPLKGEEPRTGADGVFSINRSRSRPHRQ